MTTTPPPLLAPIYLRRSTPNDGPALHAMLARCTTDTLRARFLATATVGRDGELAELVELVGDMSSATALEVYVDTVVRDGDHATVLAWQDGRVLAAGSLLPTAGATAEVALLVEDLWQDKGLGGLFAAMLAEVATVGGLDYLVAYLGTGNVRARALIRRFCPDARFLAPQDGVIDVVIPVAAISTAACEQHRIDSTGRWSQ
ncbi:GNAT family N-acetyltransferase [Lentzea sp. NPDC051213]|uniref:GNAT family N-acetyltransferase n=1 Tax=Lentzea sp. NPDC051213 TaxID=3364126 RepID=UPI0037A6D31B